MKCIRITLLLAGIVAATLLGSCNKNKPMDDIAPTTQVQQNEKEKEDEYTEFLVKMLESLDEDSGLEVQALEDGSYGVRVLTGREMAGLSGPVVCHASTPILTSFAQRIQHYSQTHHGCVITVNNHTPDGSWNVYGCK